jgi:hypothetical protein
MSAQASVEYVLGVQRHIFARSGWHQDWIVLAPRDISANRAATNSRSSWAHWPVSQQA